ncbi:glycosyltransferase [Lactovum odontotermitis]
MNDLISVVIPVYNVKNYLPKCLETVIGQTYQNIEIIFVDDGSTDESGKYCDGYARKDSRIKVVHKENAGLGQARNSGLEVCKGKYVCFIDSDDFVETDYVETLHDKILNTGASVVYCGYFDYYSKNYYRRNDCYYENKVFEKKDIGDVLAGMIGSPPEEKRDAYQSMSVCFSIYRLDLIKEYNLQFYSEREFVSEDILFNVQYLIHAEKVVCISNPLYFYRHKVSTSLTHSFDTGKFNTYKNLLLKLKEMTNQYFPKRNFDLELKRLYLSTLRSTLKNAVIHEKLNKTFDLKQYIGELINSSDTKKIIETYPYEKNPKFQRFFSHCIRHGYIRLIILLVRMNLWKKSKEA